MFRRPFALLLLHASLPSANTPLRFVLLTLLRLCHAFFIRLTSLYCFSLRCVPLCRPLPYFLAAVLASGISSPPALLKSSMAAVDLTIAGLTFRAKMTNDSIVVPLATLLGVDGVRIDAWSLAFLASHSSFPFSFPCLGAALRASQRCFRSSDQFLIFFSASHFLLCLQFFLGPTPRAYERCCVHLRFLFFCFASLLLHFSGLQVALPSLLLSLFVSYLLLRGFHCFRRCLTLRSTLFPASVSMLAAPTFFLVSSIFFFFDTQAVAHKEFARISDRFTKFLFLLHEQISYSSCDSFLFHLLLFSPSSFRCLGTTHPRTKRCPSTSSSKRKKKCCHRRSPRQRQFRGRQWPRE